MKKKKAQHGGPRTAGPGKQMGRPTSDSSKRSLSLRVSPDVREFLDTVDNISETVDEMVRRSKVFREWKRSV